MPRRIVVPAKENHKLVAAHSKYRTVAEYAAQKGRRRANVFVSGRMALSVVYKLKVVVDLRTEMEREKMPDPCLLGVAQIWNPLFKADTQGLGIFKADSSDVLYNHLAPFGGSLLADGEKQTKA